MYWIFYREETQGRGAGKATTFEYVQVTQVQGTPLRSDKMKDSLLGGTWL